MILKIEPIIRAIESIFKTKHKAQNTNPKQSTKHKSQKSKTKIILFSATGKQFTQKMARDWAGKYYRVIMVCGRYEGVDERIKKIFKMEEISVGPYVLTGGELPAMVVIDAVARHIPGVLGKEESLEEKRYGLGVPMFTRPKVFCWRGKKYLVPKVLLSGNHKHIEQWRKKAI